LKRFRLALILALAIVSLDQFTKWLVTSNLQVDQFVYPIPALSGVLAINYVTNTGVAFGLFKDANTFFIVVMLIVIGVLLRYVWVMPPEARLAHGALGLLLSGAIGNLIDRLRVGYVIDFVAVGSFPRFNVADSAVSIGVTLLALAWWLEHRRGSPVDAPIQSENAGGFGED
jgi:signal peptidase II